MAVPRVFLSSTCYDLGVIRDSLGSFIESFGFDPCLSDRGDVFYHPDLHTHDSCLSEIRNCHLLVLIIGGRFGGSYVADLKKSIVNAEFAAARELNIPVFTFVKREVLDDHRIYQKNKDNKVLDKIEFPSLDKQEHAKRVFEFIDEVRLSRTNNGFFAFEYPRDIEMLLKKQWAGMMFDFLQRRQLAEQYETQNKLLSSLAASTGQLEDLVKRLYRKADESQADAVIQIVELRSRAEQFFRELFNYFSLQGFGAASVEVLAADPQELTWYEWLASVSEFHLSQGALQAREESKPLMVNVLSYPGSHKVLVLAGTDVSDSNVRKSAELQDGFDAFRRLDEHQRREVLEQYVIRTKQPAENDRRRF